MISHLGKIRYRTRQPLNRPKYTSKKAELETVATSFRVGCHG